MVRESKRTVILDAAVTVIEAEGITAVTFDSIAAATGITRGGIIYHFSSREELIKATHQHLAQRWEHQLEAVCGKPAEQATAAERLSAYIRTAAASATRAELQMILDSQHTKHQAIWDATIDRWTGRHERGEASQDRTATLALLAADGLWVNDMLGSRPVSQEQRSETAEQIVALLQDDPSGSDRKLIR